MMFVESRLNTYNCMMLFSSKVEQDRLFSARDFRQLRSKQSKDMSIRGKPVSPADVYFLCTYIGTTRIIPPIRMLKRGKY